MKSSSIVIVVVIIIIIFLLFTWDSIYNFFLNKKILKPKKEKDEELLNDRINDKISLIEKTGIEVEEFYYETLDKGKGNGFVRIYCLVAGNDSSDNTIIYYHDGKGDMYEHYEKIIELNKYGNVIATDYRGFGKSDGYANEERIYKDSLSLWDHVTKKFRIKPSNIVLYGEGVGATFVTNLCCQVYRNNNKDIPKSVILSNPLWGHHKMFSSSVYDTKKYLDCINRLLPVSIIINSNNKDELSYAKKIGMNRNINIYNNDVSLYKIMN